MVTVKSVMAGTASFVRSSIEQVLAQDRAGGGDHAYSSRARAPSSSDAGRAKAWPPPRRPSTTSASASAPFHVVGHQHPGAARGPPDQRLQPLGRGGIEVGARLVEQEQVGVVQRGPGGGQALHHALREVAHRLARAALEADGGQRLVHALGVDPVEARLVDEVLAAAQLAVQQRVVTEVADAAPHPPGLARQLRRRARARSRRAASAGPRAPAGGWSCPRRWRRSRPASDPCPRLRVTPVRATRSP